MEGEKKQDGEGEKCIRGSKRTPSLESSTFPCDFPTIQYLNSQNSEQSNHLFQVNQRKNKLSRPYRNKDSQFASSTTFLHRPSVRHGYQFPPIAPAEIDRQVLQIFQLQQQSTQYNLMKDFPQANSTSPIPNPKKNKWKRLFKSRTGRKSTNSSESTEEYIEFEFDSDKLSQQTNDMQNNVDYFDFTFIQQ